MIPARVLTRLIFIFFIYLIPQNSFGQNIHNRSNHKNTPLDFRPCQIHPRNIIEDLKEGHKNTIIRLADCYSSWRAPAKWQSGTGWLSTNKTQLGWVSSCGVGPYHGEIMVFDMNEKLLLHDEAGCIESVEVKDLNGDKKAELIISTHGTGTGVIGYDKNIYFFNGKKFNMGNSFLEKYFNFNTILLNPTGGEIFDIEEVYSGVLTFIDKDKDGFLETAKFVTTRTFLPVNKPKWKVPKWAANQLLKEHKSKFGIEQEQEREEWIWNVQENKYIKEKE